MSFGSLSSKHIFSAIDTSHSPYLSILSHILVPSIPSCEATPLLPMSLQWSWAAKYKPSACMRGYLFSYFFKNSMASLTAFGPSCVITLIFVPGIL